MESTDLESVPLWLPPEGFNSPIAPVVSDRVMAMENPPGTPSVNFYIAN